MQLYTIFYLLVPLFFCPFAYTNDTEIIARIEKSATELIAQQHSVSGVTEAVPNAIRAFAATCDCPSFAPMVKTGEQVAEGCKETGVLLEALAELNKAIEEVLSKRLPQLKKRLACLAQDHKERTKNPDCVPVCSADRTSCMKGAIEDAQAIIKVVEPLVVGKKITATKRGESLFMRIINVYRRLPQGDTNKEMGAQIASLTNTMASWIDLLDQIKLLFEEKKP